MVIRVLKFIDKFQDCLTKKLNKQAMFICSLLALFFLGYRLYDLGGIPENLSFPAKNIFMSLIFYLLALWSQFQLWKKIMLFYNPQLKQEKLFVIHFFSQIAKYIPGGIWNYFGRNTLIDQHLGVPAQVGVRASVAEFAITIIVSVAFSSLLLINHVSLYLFIILVIGIFILAYLIIPLSLQTIMKELNVPQNLWQITNKLFFPSSFSVFFLIIAFITLCPVSLSLENYLYLSGVYIFSTLVGLLSPFPAGLGIREALTLFLLSGYIDEQLILVTTLGIRVILIWGDGIAFIISFIFDKNKVNGVHYKHQT